MQQKGSIILKTRNLQMFCLHQSFRLRSEIVKIIYIYINIFYSYQPSYLQTSSMTQPTFCLCEVS